MFSVLHLKVLSVKNSHVNWIPEHEVGFFEIQPETIVDFDILVIEDVRV